MSAHCDGNCSATQHSHRKIVVPKLKLAIIINERMIKNVSIKGMLELSSLISKNPFFICKDEQFAKSFCEILNKDYPDNRANILIPTNSECTEFATFSCLKGKTLVTANYKMGTDILDSFDDFSSLEDFVTITVEDKYKIVPVPLNYMMTLRSLTKIVPYDVPLARHYQKQFFDAKNALSDEEFDLTFRIKEEGLPTIDDSYSDALRMFLRVERKLYIQYEQ